jgi:hypothetical protein
MRHEVRLGAPGAVPGLPGGVVKPTATALLVAAAGVPER